MEFSTKLIPIEYFTENLRTMNAMGIALKRLRAQSNKANLCRKLYDAII